MVRHWRAIDTLSKAREGAVGLDGNRHEPPSPAMEVHGERLHRTPDPMKSPEATILAHISPKTPSLAIELEIGHGTPWRGKADPGMPSGSSEGFALTGSGQDHENSASTIVARSNEQARSSTPMFWRLISSRPSRSAVRGDVAP